MVVYKNPNINENFVISGTQIEKAKQNLGIWHIINSEQTKEIRTRIQIR